MMIQSHVTGWLLTARSSCEQPLAAAVLDNDPPIHIKTH